MNMPYSSTRKPIRGQRIRINVSPAKKAAVPFAFCFRAKKTRVFWGPIMIVKPMRKRIYFVTVLVMSETNRNGLSRNIAVYGIG